MATPIIGINPDDLLEDPSLAVSEGPDGITEPTDPVTSEESDEDQEEVEEDASKEVVTEGGQPLSDDLAAAISGIVERAWIVEQYYRESMLRVYKRNSLFWDGYQFIYWSDVAGDWQGPQLYNKNVQFDPELTQDIENYTKVINIYRSHGESVIGALSSTIPTVRSFPEDPDDPEDLLAASTRTKIAEIIQDQNNAQMLFVRALFILWNYGWVAAYNTHHSDKKYGVFKGAKLGMEEQTITSTYCPNCFDELPREFDSTSTLQPTEASNTGEEVQENSNADLLGIQICANCGEQVVPIAQESVEQVPVNQGTVDIPKGREVVELYGPLHVTIPVTARRQEDVGYIFLDDEFHYAQIRALFPDRWQDIQPGGSWKQYERWARHATGLESLEDQVTVRRVWLRPHMFWTIDDDEQRAELFNLFPNGAYAVFVNDELMEVYDESLDEHWTLTVSPVSQSIGTTEPLGRSLIPIQETTNEAYNLTLQQMQYGISETFVDQEILDFDEYRKTANEAGMMYPVKNPTPGRPIADNFFQLKAATMSKEIAEFMQKLEQVGQFVTGSFPSIYGGPSSSSGSKTLGEYEQSRNQSLQRLSLPWKMVNDWWALIMDKAVASFVKHLLEDEKFVQKQGSSYISVWIRRADLIGRVGTTRSETSDQFPLSWAQQGAVIFKLLGLQIPEISQTLMMPENASLVSNTFGLTKLKLPGEADRNKQLSEISQMLRGTPVMVDQMLDNHQVEALTCRDWLISAEGQDARYSNPQSYQLVYMHFMEHQQIIQMQMQAAAISEGPANSEENPPAEGEQ